MEMAKHMFHLHRHLQILPELVADNPPTFPPLLFSLEIRPIWGGILTSLSQNVIKTSLDKT